MYEPMNCSSEPSLLWCWSGKTTMIGSGMGRSIIAVRQKDTENWVLTCGLMLFQTRDAQLAGSNGHTIGQGLVPAVLMDFSCFQPPQSLFMRAAFVRGQ